MKTKHVTAIIAASRHRETFAKNFPHVVGRKDTRVGGRLTRIETPTEDVIFVHPDDLIYLRGRDIDNLILSTSAMEYKSLRRDELRQFYAELDYICHRNQLPRITP